MQSRFITAEGTAKYPKVSIVVLNWNGLEDTLECLGSLKRIDYPNYDVIVLDNGSEGDDAKSIEERFRNFVYLVRCEKNHGFAQGNNIAVQEALIRTDPDYILLLNNDVVVDSKFLTELVNVAESDPQIGIVGPKIYMYGSSILDSAGSLYTNIGSCRSRGHLEKDKGRYTLEEVPMITACCMLFRREILDKTYLFDPFFFLYYEEFDFNIRVRRLGYRIYYTHRSVVYHKFSRSTKKLTANVTLLKRFYASRGRAKILLRHYPLAIILRNLHLIILSYVYSEYRLLLHGGPILLFKLNTDLIRLVPSTLKERLVNGSTTGCGWVDWVRTYSLGDYLALKNAMEKRRVRK